MMTLDLAPKVQKALDEAGIRGKVQAEQTPVPGVVRLTGQVPAEDERLRADQIARSVDEVLDVMDEIKIGTGRGR
ncbi:MAG TPA: BON domain-containing protein [Armatimonadota bacterium]|nr:BON domain-containing protein [Armatimonadota bacterium]